jgi:TetR/AcrR family transcriptional regulator, repressor of the mexAB-oprM multidrug resistance operon
VPVARTNMERQAKVQEILDAAQRRLLAYGYEGMSVAAIARELSIAQNSVYWYFPSKDDLFVAALREILDRVASRKPPAQRGLVERVLWATDQLAEFAPLRAALRTRAAHCEAAAALHSDLAEWLRIVLLQAIEPVADPQEAAIAAQALLATVEGALSMDLPKQERRRLIAFVYGRIVSAPAGPDG